jgi:hypothetical protein
VHLLFRNLRGLAMVTDNIMKRSVFKSVQLIILIVNTRIQSSPTNNLYDSYSFKWRKVNHLVIVALQVAA